MRAGYGLNLELAGSARSSCFVISDNCFYVVASVNKRLKRRRAIWNEAAAKPLIPKEYETVGFLHEVISLIRHRYRA